jgi:hypothetical protein
MVSQEAPRVRVKLMKMRGTEYQKANECVTVVWRGKCLDVMFVNVSGSPERRRARGWSLKLCPYAPSERRSRYRKVGEVGEM